MHFLDKPESKKEDFDICKGILDFNSPRALEYILVYIERNFEMDEIFCFLVKKHISSFLQYHLFTHTDLLRNLLTVVDTRILGFRRVLLKTLVLHVANREISFEKTISRYNFLIDYLRLSSETDAVWSTWNLSFLFSPNLKGILRNLL